jgi:hypothetical protein
MQNVPKIVRERLKASPSPVSHPDADVLTAFSEQALPAVERATVLEHLARCTDCREIVARALPETEITNIATTAAHSRWFTWPALRWAFVAAGIVAVASVGIVQYQHGTRTGAMNLQTSQRSEPSATEAKNQPPVTVSPGTERNEDKPKTKNKDQESRAVSSNAANGVVNEPNPATHADVLHQSQAFAVGGPVVHKEMGFAGQPQPSLAQNQAPVSTPPAAFAKQRGASTSAVSPAPSAAETIEVTGQAPLVADAQAQTAQLQSQSAEPQSPPDYSARVGKAKPVVTTEAAAAAPVAQPGISSTTQQQIQSSAANVPMNGRNVTDLNTLSPPPRWTIGTTGTLQRSFDQGKTWQDVNVIASAVSSYNLVMAEAVPQLSQNKENDATKKSLKRAAVSIFRAVSATGSEVWAGGSPSMLYHSSDAGNHWTRVLPSANGTVLTGDVVTVEFSDPQHGRIATSTSEVWTTADDGQTWQEQ